MITLTCPLCGERTMSTDSQPSKYYQERTVCHGCYLTETGNEQWAYPDLDEEEGFEHDALRALNESIDDANVRRSTDIIAIAKPSAFAALAHLSYRVAKDGIRIRHNHDWTMANFVDSTPTTGMQIAVYSLNHDPEMAGALIRSLLERADDEEIAHAVMDLARACCSVSDAANRTEAQERASRPRTASLGSLPLRLTVGAVAALVVVAAAYGATVAASRLLP